MSENSRQVFCTVTTNFIATHILATLFIVLKVESQYGLDSDRLIEPATYEPHNY